jgi:hypothetical protein
MPGITLALRSGREFAPVSPAISPSDKTPSKSRLRCKHITAYERNGCFSNKSVDRNSRSSNIPWTDPNRHPHGEFHVYSKMPSKHMGNGQLTADIEAYELPGVPWTTSLLPMASRFTAHTGMTILV